MRLPILAGLPLLAIQLALLEWSRAAELSCDRAAALVTRDPQAVCRALMVMAAGEAADDLNLDAFIAQGMEYSEGGSGLERVTQAAPGPARDPPDAGAARAACCSTGCARATTTAWSAATTCAAARSRRRARRPRRRAVYYADRIGGAIQAAGSSVSEVGQQLGDWLKRTASLRRRPSRLRASRRTAATVNGSSGVLPRLSNCELTTSRRLPAICTVVGKWKLGLVMSRTTVPRSQSRDSFTWSP